VPLKLPRFLLLAGTGAVLPFYAITKVKTTGLAGGCLLNDFKYTAAFAMAPLI